jgi:hypothetical protein
MYPIYKSKTPSKRKIALMIVFALGALWVSKILMLQWSNQLLADLDSLSVAVTSILRMQTLNFSSTSPDTTCKYCLLLFRVAFV